MTTLRDQSSDLNHTSASRSLTPGIVIGLGSALIMWLAWLGTHAPAILSNSESTASPTVTGIAVALAMVLSIGWGVSRATGTGWKLGLIAGGVAGLVNLMLLGSILTEQPENTAQMNEAANQFKSNALMITTGFLAISLAAGAVAGLAGASMRRTQQADRPGAWIARMSLITVLAMVPLIAIGGAVTSTESGMAVPDGVTSYGAVSVLFPISLMAEPRIFLEHTHRLFGMLVGLNAIVLAVMVMRAHKPGRLIGIVGSLVLMLWAAGAMGAMHSGKLGETGMVILTGLAGIAGLGFTHAMMSRRKLPAAAAGLLALVVIQGLLGMQRVDENLVWVAMFHGLFAQMVVMTAVMVAAALSPSFASPIGGVLPQTQILGARLFKLSLIALVLTTLQLILGAASRHLNTGSTHATMTHMANSFLVLGLVIVVASLLTKGDTQTEIGRTIKRIGAALMGVMGIQFLLGWAALGMVGIGREPQPIPLSGELDTAQAIRLGEAIVTTSHQVGGAALLALLALAATWAKRAKRADDSIQPEPIASADESEPAEPTAG